jgi:hypothetical protein
MDAYICLIMNGARLRAFGIECADDAAAVEQATTALNSHPGNRSIEIWQSGRFVGKLKSGYAESFE